jgi:hypothetical protein
VGRDESRYRRVRDLERADGDRRRGRQKKLGARDSDRRFEYRLAGYLGTTRKQLLRALDAEEWLDWRVLESIEPFGPRRDDLRFAVLAQVLVGALGAKKLDGTPFTASDFQRLLDLDDTPRAPGKAPAPALTQTAEEAERRLESWLDGNNRAWIEDPARGGR